MTQEDKELLLQDLCARLYCGVKAKSPTSHLEINTIDGYFVDGDGTKMFHLSEPDFWQEVEYFQYYLRPLSSMTEKEKNDLLQLMGRGTDIERIDFYIFHHFDYHGLIPKGLALEAPKGMYNIK